MAIKVNNVDQSSTYEWDENPIIVDLSDELNDDWGVPDVIIDLPEITINRSSYYMRDPGSFFIEGDENKNIIQDRVSKYKSGDLPDVIGGGAGGDFIRAGSSTFSAIYNNPADPDDPLNGEELKYGGDLIYGDGVFVYHSVTGQFLGVDTSAPGGNDTLYGYGGQDTIFGFGGDDIINGGNEDPDDYFPGTYEFLSGGDGNDTILGGYGNEQIYGGAGDDLITTSLGDHTVVGGAGDDVIVAGGGDDVLGGGDDNDNIVAGAGNDEVVGGNGNDTVIGGLGIDTIEGNAGDDELDGNEGGDFIFGGGGDDLLTGGGGDDQLVGGDDDDVLDGGPGNNFLIGGDINPDGTLGTDNSLNDTVTYAGEGTGVNVDISLFGLQQVNGERADAFFGDIENVVGSDFNDTIAGTDGVNNLDGGEGDDRIYGNAGDDIIAGGSGQDLLFGNDATGAPDPIGSDRFVFDNTGLAPQFSVDGDFVLGFSSGTEDKLDFGPIFDATFGENAFYLVSGWTDAEAANWAYNNGYWGVYGANIDLGDGPKLSVVYWALAFNDEGVYNYYDVAATYDVATYQTDNVLV